MDCERFRRMISKKLDGELSRDDELLLSKHLEVCPDCSRFFALTEQSNELYRGMAEVEVPGTILPAIIAETTAKERTNVFLPRWLKVAVAAASIVTVLAGIDIGKRLVDTYTSSDQVTLQETLGLDYLSENPPGSLGNALLASSGGGQDE
ncbi:MAG: hypothetical protein B6D63_05100 [Candidatus Latescibacteria bacterium 4484_7]|nr:MAG: hypothetical protein B6D63_05100 [Candidatus Latescibacteria bacterium 4484_7]RKZ08985.1 MAG: hypothetical protein DRQ05_00540 [bacterium]